MRFARQKLADLACFKPKAQQRKSMRKSWLVLWVCLLGTPSVANAGVEKEKDGFEKRQWENWSVQLPAQPKDTEALLQRSKKARRKGKFGLLLRYRQRGERIALHHFVRLRDFTQLSIWVKSQQAGRWELRLEDSKKRVYTTRFSLKAGRWQALRLRPKQCKPTARGQKPLDVAHLTYGYTLTPLDPTGKQHNVVFLDQFVVQRRTLEEHQGALILTGTTKRITKPTRIRGDLILLQHAKLSVATNLLEVHGNIIINNAKLELSNSFVHIKQSHPWQYRVVIGAGGLLRASHTRWAFNYPLSFLAQASAKVFFRQVTSRNQRARFSFRAGSSLKMTRCQTLGRLQLHSGARVRILHSKKLWLVLTTKHGIQSDFSLPSRPFVPSWIAPPTLKMDLFMLNNRSLRWSLILASGSSVTIRHSKLHSVGFLFQQTRAFTLKNLKPQKNYPDRTFKTPHHRLRLFKTHVQHWELHARNNASLSLHNSQLRLLTLKERASISAQDVSLHSKGFSLRLLGRAQLTLKASSIQHHALAQESSLLRLHNTSVQGDLWLTEHALALLRKATIKGTIQKRAKGKAQRSPR